MVCEMTLIVNKDAFSAPLLLSFSFPLPLFFQSLLSLFLSFSLSLSLPPPFPPLSSFPPSFPFPPTFPLSTVEESLSPSTRERGEREGEREREREEREEREKRRGKLERGKGILFSDKRHFSLSSLQPFSLFFVTSAAAMSSTRSPCTVPSGFPFPLWGAPSPGAKKWGEGLGHEPKKN